MMRMSADCGMVLFPTGAFCGMVFRADFIESSLTTDETSQNSAYAKEYVSIDIETKERVEPAHAFKKRSGLNSFDPQS